MEFIDLKAQQARIRGGLHARIAAVLEHGHYIMGPEVAELEQALAAFTGAKHCLACASGTDALLMPLMGREIGPGDAVFVPAFTFFATAEMPALLGATPVFVDIDPVSFNLAPGALRRAVRAVLEQDPSVYPLPSPALQRRLKPRAVIPVDLFGQPAAYAELLSAAADHGLLALEDAAQSFGAGYRGRKTCALGCDCAATSFFPAKPLGCYGDGGAIFTNDDELAERLVSIRVHGKGRHKYENVRLGLNGRLDTLQAAVLLAKMTVFPDEIRLRQQVAAWYGEGLSELSGLIPPAIGEDCLSVFAQYSVRIADGRRDFVAQCLRARDIPTNIYYPKPLHVQRAFAALGYREADMPVASACARDILSLPFHPYMERRDVDAVCAALKEALA